MAGKRFDICIFCEEAPCVCNKPAEKPKRAAAPRPVKAKAAPKIVATETAMPERPAQKPRLDPLEAMKARAAQNPVTEMKLSASQAKTVDTKARVAEADDPEFASSVRALQSILATSEKIKYARILQSKPTLAERAVTWRRRNAYRKEMGQ